MPELYTSLNVMKYVYERILADGVLMKFYTDMYLKIPSSFEVHIITALSALPEANFFPSFE